MMSEYNIKLEKFEGPLDLLLKLIEAEEVTITEVSLAKVTDQFIEYVNQSQDLDPGEVADFLVVASKLLLIKSKILMPSLDFEEEEEGSLEFQLKIYKEYYEASKKIKELIRRKNFMFSRNKSIQVFTPKFSPPLKLKLKELGLIFQLIVNRLEPVVNLPKDVIKKTISIGEKIRQIKEMILEKVSFSFKSILSRGDKTEVIVSFLALLELVKQQSVKANQTGLFGEIRVDKNGE
jgi:segregation and condensation protein A